MRREQLGQIERRGDANTQRILKFFITALVDSLHQRQRIVDEIVNAAGFVDHFLGKIFQNHLVREIPHVVISGRFVDHINLYALLAEFFSNAFTNSMRAAGYYGCFLYVVHNLTSLAIDLWGRLFPGNRPLGSFVQYNSFNTSTVIPGLSPGMILFTFFSYRYQS